MLVIEIVVEFDAYACLEVELFMMPLVHMLEANL